jgi:ECF sigma factor
VPQLPSEAVSELLVKWRAGDEQALQALIPLVYKELHTLAHHYLRQERSGHALQTTALVHEAYLRMVKLDVALPQALSSNRSDQSLRPGLFAVGEIGAFCQGLRGAETSC